MIKRLLINQTSQLAPAMCLSLLAYVPAYCYAPGTDATDTLHRGMLSKPRAELTNVSATLNARKAEPQAVAPAFAYPFTPTNGQIYQVAPGQIITFGVQAADADAGDQVTLQMQGLPGGATMAPALPANGNPVQSTLSWTPTAADIGSYLVTFTAKDGQNTQASTSVTIRVAAACSPGPNQPVANPDQLNTASSTALVITPAQLLANDTDPQNRTLRVVGVGTPSSGTLTPNADGTFTYVPQSGFVGSTTFTYAVQPAGAVLSSAATGHFYEFVSAPNICWAAARTAAAARTYNGLAGYLATVTSANEKDYLAAREPGKYWLGGADDLVEGEWRWKTGPEAGQLFWLGVANGTTPSYSHWSTSEPNDFQPVGRPLGEDYTLFYGGSGLWNDMDDCDVTNDVAGYIVEYGGLETCTPVLYATGTVTVNIGTTSGLGAGFLRAGIPNLLEAAPNPATGHFRVRVMAAAEGTAQLDLFDMQGRHISSLFTGALQAGKLREVPVEAQGLAAGVYSVRLISQQQVQQLRVVIQK